MQESDNGIGYKHLVTTAIKETWPDSGEMIMLGSWCLRYSLESDWGLRNYTVLQHPWDTRSKISADLEYIDFVYEELLSGLSLKLNEIHRISRSKRYWRIVVGPWLYLFTQVVYERWMMISLASSQHSGLVLNRLTSAICDKPPIDMADFRNLVVTDDWNEVICADIVELLGDIEVNHLPMLAQQFTRVNSPEKQRVTRSVYRNTTRALDNIRRWLGITKLRYFLYMEYLRPLPKLKFALITGTFPILNARSRQTPDVTVSERKWVITTEIADAFSTLMTSLIPTHLPSDYLESFAKFSKEVSSPKWFLARAEVLVTANAFDSDDAWKIWAAGQVEQGSKLVIAQHGGHYGTGAWSAPQNHEIAIADRYLSWGWKDANHRNVVPAPATKLIGLGSSPRITGESCLSALAVLPRYSYWVYSVPIAHQYELYLQNQEKFISRLSPNIRTLFELRLTQDDFGWDLRQRFRDFDRALKIDEGKGNFHRKLKESKLFVATYNATTFLESFTLGVPTVMHWDPNFWELCGEAEPFYELLRDAGVLFSDPELCAQHVNEIWTNVPGWWKSKKVKNAINIFTNEYAYVGDRPLRELKSRISELR